METDQALIWGQARFLKRQDSLPVSMSSHWAPLVQAQWRGAGVGEAVEERGGHLGIAEDRASECATGSSPLARGPCTKGEVRGDDDRGPLVEAADQVDVGGSENSPGASKSN